jgi:hypothetical protein
MSAASNEAQPIEANVETSATFGAALAAIQAAERMYLHLGRVTASSCDYQEPALFCDEILKRALAVAELAGAEARARFFAWATDAAPRCKLLSVLACTDHLMRGESHLARMYAKRALSLNQNDLHAQTLYRRCLRRRPSDPDLRGRFCDNPFDKLETHTRGRSTSAVPPGCRSRSETSRPSRPRRSGTRRRLRTSASRFSTAAIAIAVACTARN